LISKYGLDCKEYQEYGENDYFIKVTWESSTLRTWLNEEFYQKTFNKIEQEQIKETLVKAEQSPKYNTDPGNDTRDKIFLLNIQEAEKYFDSDDARICFPTKYAVTNGRLYHSGACCWWLRSPGYSDYLSSAIYLNGSICWNRGTGEIRTVVRPALRLNL